MAMRPAVSYMPYATSSGGETGNIITFAMFEENYLLYETREDMESGNESDENSNLPPLISEEEIHAMSSGDKSDSEPMYMDMLEDICDGRRSHTSINMREARYKIRGCI